MRKLIICAAFVVALALPAAASAEPSPCGATHGAFANVNGNFGFLGGLHGTPWYNGNKEVPAEERAVGQEPGATGYNNKTASEAVCTP
jgi:hypothetical protein